ncbi:MAG: DeoR/GlpR family DNA-binding transcription regulator [Actinobacteria bacterium]|nr:DeoR/GlpR family DNA-binding transcription regulator [Actinomycetota bacterium]
MLSAERKVKIAQIVSESGGIKTSELSNMFNVSEMTVLRDLAILEEEGLLKRVYGGAVVTRDASHEISSILRKEIQTQEKNIISEKALEMVDNGDCIFLDGSTTALALAKKLHEKNDITVITNGLDVVNEIKNNNNIKLICLGGELYNITMNFTGPFTESFLRNFYADKCFISTAALSLKSGLTVENQSQVLLKKIMIENSSKRIALIDSSKFGRVALSKVCSFNEIDTIITDKKPPDDYLKLFKENNLEIIY